MNKKKLQLQELKVTSFVTLSRNESQDVKGGSYESFCDLSCLEPCHTLLYSLDLPCMTDACQPCGGGTKPFDECGTQSCPFQDQCM